MAFDTRRVLLAAAEAALKEAHALDQPARPRRQKRRLPARRAVLIGAGLMTVGRLAAGSRGRQLLGAVEHRLGDLQSWLLEDEVEIPVEDLIPDEDVEIPAERVTAAREDLGI
jgi:ferric-dicitrate binding protein FerR (iron transport regulator)